MADRWNLCALLANWFKWECCALFEVIILNGWNIKFFACSGILYISTSVSSFFFIMTSSLTYGSFITSISSLLSWTFISVLESTGLSAIIDEDSLACLLSTISSLLCNRWIDCHGVNRWFFVAASDVDSHFVTFSGSSMRGIFLFQYRIEYVASYTWNIRCSLMVSCASIFAVNLEKYWTIACCHQIPLPSISEWKILFASYSLLC